VALADAAFVLSVLSLASSLLLAWVRWPRIDVELNQTVIVDGSNRDALRLAVINRGAEAMTIRNIGLTIEGGSRKLDHQELVMLRLNGLSEAPLPTGPDLPCRVEGHGCLVWVYTEEMLATSFVKGNLMHPYADRYKLFRLWPWWPRKTNVSKVKRETSYDQTALRNGPG
jgi:hypothetical protein